ncbi:cation diffusion facilitator family transporter [Bacteroidetes bacterium UKL13-3]|nr:cation diffusion facilitator family transporter [Bacteroidetes bacterium UKL13-3]
MEKSSYIKIKAIRNVLIAGIVIMLIKFIAFFITHSNAILSDALESIINVVAGAFAYYSLKVAAKPKDIDHPYGHGKIEFISAGFEGGLILLAGIVIIGKSIMNMLHPIPIDKLEVGALLATVAGIANFLLGRFLIKTGENHKSITLIADGKHLQSDTWSSLGLVVGVVIIHLTGLVYLDNVFAIIFGGIIIFTGYNLVRKSLAGLMDEADESIIKGVIEVLNENRNENWIDIHNLRILQYGSSYHIDCHITLPWYNDLKTSHDELKNIEELITAKFHDKVELFIHPDPCLPFSCSLCQLTACAVRIRPFESKIEWTSANVMRNEKHRL